MIDDETASRADILKMDVQGAELMVISGASKVLSNASIVLTEVAFEAQYAGHPLVDDVENALADYGFVRQCFYGSMRPDVWGDGLYVRPELL